MLQQLALETGAEAWAVASMLFFIAVFAVVAHRAHRTPSRTHQAHARLPLEEAAIADEAVPHAQERAVHRSAGRATGAPR